MSQDQLVDLRGPLKKRIKNRFRQLRRFLTLIESQCEKEQQNLPYANDEANDDYWQFQAEPFYADCCVALLASGYHTCERCLKEIYALTRVGGSEEVRRLDMKELCKLFEGLGIKIEEKTIDEYRAVDTLRLFVNSWKHDPSEQADPGLRKKLKILKTTNLAPLVESPRIREELCNILQISPNSFPEIAKEWLSVTERFVLAVFKQSAFQIKPQKRKPVSLNPKDFLQ